LIELLGIKLGFAGNLLGRDEMIVTESAEGTLLADVNLHFALLRINRIGRGVLRTEAEWGE